MIYIDLKQEGFESEIDTYFKELDKLTENIADDVTAITEEAIHENILLSRGIDGKPVVPLSPYTIFIKSIRNYPYPSRPLYMSGDMLNSVMSDSNHNIYIGGKPDNYAWRVVYGAGGGDQPPRDFFHVFDSPSTDKTINKSIKMFYR